MMGLYSNIPWTTHTLNTWIGCTQIYEGCRYCYAKREMRRWGKDFNTVTRTSKQTWDQVSKYKPGDRVFVCSWSDFFHPDADPWRNDAWEKIRSRPDVIWIILTKRIDRIHRQSQLPKNLWLGVSVSTNKDLWMVKQLLEFDVSVKVLSIEPMLEPIELRGAFIAAGLLSPSKYLPQWAIIGCESLPGLKAGRFRDGFIEAARSVVRQCQAAGVPVYVKQLTIKGKVSRNPKDWPEDLRLQDYPKKR